MYNILYNRELGASPRTDMFSNCKYSVDNYNLSSFNPRKFIEQSSMSPKQVRRMKIAARLDKQGHSGCVNTVNWNQRGDVVISGSDDTQVICWDAFKQKKLVQFETRHRGNIFCAAFMPYTQDSKIITCARDGAIHYFDLMKNQSAKQENSYEYHSYCTTMSSVKISSPFVRAFEDHTESVHKLVAEPNSSYVFLSCSQDGTSRVYDLRTPNIRDNILVNLRGNNNRLGTSSCDLDSITINDRKPYLFAVAGGDPYVRVYDRRKTSPECVQVFSTKELIRKTNRSNSLIPVHITGVRFDDFRNQIAASYSGDSIYTFQLDDSSSSGNSTQNVNGINVSTDFCKQFKGHRNIRTVKEVHYLGSHNNFIISGSDCGRVFFYDNNTDTSDSMEDEDVYFFSAALSHSP